MKKLLIAFSAISLICAQLFISYQPASAAANCKVLDPYYVSQVQQGLKNKGYNPGTVDGLMGPNTCNAIIKFQKAKKLTADGIVGSKTGSALGLSTKISCGSGYTTCFLAVERTGYQGSVYAIKNGKVLKKLQATFGGYGHRTPTGKYSIFRTEAGEHTSTVHPSKEPNMNYPLYFKYSSTGDFAIHGSKALGASSGSSGCVRIGWSASKDLYNSYYKKQAIKTVIVRR